MKIVQLLPELNEGGVERGTVDLSRELVQQNIQSVVISNGGRLVEKVEEENGTHIKLNLRSKNIFTAPWRIYQLRKILKKLNPSVLHVRSRVPAWLTYFANKSLKIPIVSTVHGFNSVNAYSAIMTKADALICSSKFLIEHIIKNYNADRNIINLIPRGIDSKEFSEDNLDHDFISTFKSQYALNDKYIITQVARITGWKDQLTVIYAFEEIKKTIPNAKLLLVGGVDEKREHYYKEIKDRSEKSRYKEDIVFTGNQQHIKEILYLSNINISASVKPETFGRANVEGLFMGTPLIATNIGATSDYVRVGVTGYFFNPKDDKQLAKNIIKLHETPLCKQTVQDFANEYFNLELMIKRKIDLYKSLEK